MRGPTNVKSIPLGYSNNKNLYSSVKDNYIFGNKLEYLIITVVKLYAFYLYTQPDYGLVLSQNMLLSSSLPIT